MKIETVTRALVGISMLLCGQAVWAGRPFATEDAGVIAAAACEIEAFAASVGARTTPSERGGWGQISCGIGANTQIGAGLGRTKADDHYNTSGALIGKTALRRLSEGSMGLAVAYSFGAIKRASEAVRRDASSFSMALSIPRGRTLVHANLGVARSHIENETTATYALALERLGEQGLDVGVEVFGREREAAWIGTGARYAVLPEKLSIDFSFAQQIDSLRTRLLTVGAKYAF